MKLAARSSSTAIVSVLLAVLGIAFSAAPAQALGKETHTWNTYYFDASITVNWESKHSFTLEGWLEDTKCDGRGVYLDAVYAAHKTADGWRLGSSWWLGYKDANGCDNGRVAIPKVGYTDSDHNVPYIKLWICSKDQGDPTYVACYPWIWDNPYLDN